MGIFISLVGFQSMAVVSPLITLIAKDIITKPVEVYLMHTIKSTDSAKRIQTYLQNLHSDMAVQLKEVSNSLQDPNAPQSVLKEILDDYKKEKIYFNLAGAMNYQISACILSLDPYRTVYIYPESDGIRLFEIEDLCKVKMSEYETVIEKDFEVYFRLQGIPFKTLEKVNHPSALIILNILIDRLLAHNDSVIYDKAVRIGNVNFNYVFNSKNELIFVYETNKYTDTAEIRRIINLATNRKDFGELLHHKIVVITSNKLHKERLRSESGGKVLVIDHKESQFEIAMRKAQAAKKYEQELVTTNNNRVSNKTLYLALGKDIMPTLIAMWSHKPKKACILYTPHDETIARYKQAMIKHKDILPCSEIVFIPTDITCKEILNYKPQEDEQIECNITPGTKAQGAFLSIFAKMHNGTVWSINQDGEGSISQIPDGKNLPLSIVKIENILKLKGNEGFNIKVFNSNSQKLYSALREFLRVIKETEYLKLFPYSNFEIPNRDVSFKDSKFTIYKKNYSLDRKKSNWFEEFTAWVLFDCGAYDIALNYTQPWSSEIEQEIRKNNPDYKKVHKTEIDILAIYREKYFVVSCKSGIDVSKGESIADLKGTVPILGRFAIPLLSCLRHRGEPEVIDGVYVFGVDTLCSKEKMQELLKDAIEARRTTT